MPVPTFVRNNAVLLVGLTLPVVLMLGFFAAASLPESLSDPPKYDLVFSVLDYQAAPSVPGGVRLVVKDGVLKAQYTKLPAAARGGYASAGWRKLYLYDAASRTVRQLEFGFPPDLDAIEGTREDTVAATAGLQLDTRARSRPTATSCRTATAAAAACSARSSSARGHRTSRGCARAPPACRSAPTGSRRLRYGSAEFVGWVTGKR